MGENRKVVLFIATSLDGYIATKDETLDWLFQVEGEGDNGYSEFYESVDTILMGRKTYDWIIKHETGGIPYQGKECYVFSKSLTEDDGHVSFINDDFVSFVESLKGQDGKNIWLVGGGELIQLFAKEKLIDKMIITVAPTIIGSGIPLFKEGEYSLDLVLNGTRTFNQFVELQYEVKKDASL